MRLRFVLLAAVLSVCVALPVSSNVQVDPVALPEATVDLSVAPEKRWDPVIRQVVADKGWNNTFGPLAHYIDAFISPSMQPAVEFVLARLDPLLGEYGAEMRGIAQTIKELGHEKEFNLGKIVAVNLVYEVSAMCTSIVARAPDGTMWHGRNLDWEITGGFHNMAYKINYVNGTTPVFSALHILGYIGVLTGVRPNGISVSLDERDTKDGTLWENVYEALLKHGKLATFELRASLEKGEDFDSTVKRMSTIHLIAPSYLIIGGVGGRGAVVTRGRDAAVDVWQLNTTSTANDAWFLVETNYDHWMPPPSSDDRRDPAIASLNALGQANINQQSMLKVMSKPPVCACAQ